MKKAEEKKENSIRFKDSNAFGCLILFCEFFKIGLFTIGGGMSMIPQIHHVAVNV